jgi:putative ATPase
MTRDITRNPVNNTKLAPIFSLGKRGPETRPTSSQDDVEMLAAYSSSQAQPVDVGKEPTPPAKRARRTEGEPSPNKGASVQMASIFAPKGPLVQAPPGGYLKAAAPLAEQLRPQTLDDFVGQEHLTGLDGLLFSLMESGNMGSMILWGPPGYVSHLGCSAPALICRDQMR